MGSNDPLSPMSVEDDDQGYDHLDTDSFLSDDEAHPQGEPVTTEFVKDHVAFWDGKTRPDAPVVTLSGLRGTMSECVPWFSVPVPTAYTLADHRSVL